MKLQSQVIKDSPFLEKLPGNQGIREKESKCSHIIRTSRLILGSNEGSQVARGVRGQQTPVAALPLGVTWGGQIVTPQRSHRPQCGLTCEPEIHPSEGPEPKHSTEAGE